MSTTTNIHFTAKMAEETIEKIHAVKNRDLQYVAGETKNANIYHAEGDFAIYYEKRHKRYSLEIQKSGEFVQPQVLYFSSENLDDIITIINCFDF
jgi:hypothetical protein